ncbi:COA8 family protein CG14806, mitochondrial [Daktulosphaira vitifoliae]|uniref:COA8 family protein CG14806, mitochondrial n=1 Tax=Daktulosphaira vitifoliae TaxID=58002 RepID=UPI0021AA8733|nr:COA8 family protein CG14806, mitochondrial [Daktulosphaira vitifoliae]
MENDDSVGPPDPISNLRPIKFYIPKNESSIERKLRLKRIEVAKWNNDFWTNHNQTFVKEREAYKEKLARKGISSASADQMSEFYKEFLDKNWKTHVTYNFECITMGKEA